CWSQPTGTTRPYWAFAPVDRTCWWQVGGGVAEKNRRSLLIRQATGARDERGVRRRRRDGGKPIKVAVVAIALGTRSGGWRRGVGGCKPAVITVTRCDQI